MLDHWSAVLAATANGSKHPRQDFQAALRGHRHRAVPREPIPGSEEKEAEHHAYHR
jgi:hypothetical protein